MLNILFSGNGKVVDGVITCMLSIFKRTDTKEPFCFYIYTMDITRIKPEYLCTMTHLQDRLTLEKYGKIKDIVQI